MPIFVVTSKVTGIEVTRYAASSATESVGYSFSGYDHTLVEEQQEAHKEKVITKLAYMNRFTDVELAGIFTAAKQSVLIEVWLEKFKVAEEINTADEDNMRGLLALESIGLIAEGRAQEILYGE